VVLSSFVVVMDVSIVNVAMPQMLGAFGVTLDAITWVAVAYTYCISSFDPGCIT